MDLTIYSWIAIGLCAVLIGVSKSGIPGAGILVVPAGCRYRATEFFWTVFNFLPSAGAANSNQEVIHEWMGLAWYWLKGRI